MSDSCLSMHRMRSYEQGTAASLELGPVGCRTTQGSGAPRCELQIVALRHRAALCCRRRLGMLSKIEMPRRYGGV